MHDVEQPHRQNVRLILLDLLYQKSRDGLLTDDISAPPDFRDRYRASYANEDRTDPEIWEVFRQTFSDLRYSGFLTFDQFPAGQGLLRIRPDGIRELGRLRPGVSYDQLDKLGGILLEQAADLQETIDKTTEEEARLAQGIAAFDEKIAALRGHVDKSVNGVDAKLAQMQRDLYNQVLVLMSVFVAAFALILTGAQVVQTTARGTAGGWFQIALDSFAIMIPITAAVVILVIVTWLVTRPRSVS